MRALVVVLLAGCYQPAASTSCDIACTTSCPPGLDCLNGVCVAPGVTCPPRDVDADPVDDVAAPALCTIPTVVTAENLVVDGSTFVARLDGEMYATRFTLEGAAMDVGTVRGTLGSIGQAASYQIIVQDSAVLFHRSPHLARSGQELFLRLQPMGGVPRLARTTRMPGTNTWTNLTQQNITGTSIVALDEPSTPTTTMPRRMVISRATGGFIELEETTPGSAWALIATQADTGYDFGADKVTFLGDAHLTPDGRRLVFRGQVNTGIIGAFVIERAKLDEKFGGQALQLPAGGSVSHPYWTPDCKTLFYDRANEGFVYRVDY